LSHQDLVSPQRRVTTHCRGRTAPHRTAPHRTAPSVDGVVVVVVQLSNAYCYVIQFVIVMHAFVLTPIEPAPCTGLGKVVPVHSRKM